MNESTPSNGTNSPEVPSAAASRVECAAARDPAIRLLIAAAMLIGMGLWCFLDRDRYDPPPAWDRKHINEASKYVFNAYGVFVFTPPGVVLAIWTVIFLRRRLLADAEGIGYVGKEKIPWSAIVSLDASQARSKGIVVLHYGEGKKLVLDNWKLTNFRELISLVESRIPPEKVKSR